MADVSVVIPTRNRLELLSWAIESCVGGNGGTHVEVIVVDDGSKDGTADFVRGLEASDQRVQYLERTGPNGGANVARNQGVQAARADLVVFLDSDDLLRPVCLARRVATMRANPVLDFALGGGAVFEREQGDLGPDRPFAADSLEGDLDRFLALDYPWEITSPIWRRDVLLRLGPFDESMLSWQDVDLHVRALVAGLTYVRLGGIDHDIRWQNDPAKTSLMQRCDPAYLRNGEAWTERMQGLLDEHGLLTWKRRRALAGLSFQLAEWWIRRGDISSAYRLWNRTRGRRLLSPLMWAQGWAVMTLLARAPDELGQRVAWKWRREARLA